MRPLKSYARVGAIDRPDQATAEGEPTPRSILDLSEEIGDAGRVLENYVAIASFNIGKATLIKLLQVEIDHLSE
ncbi:hypothetical protein V6767_12905 [Martelella sp. FLE1502]